MGKTREDSFLTFGSPLIGEEEIEEVLDTLRSGWLSTGPKTHRFEEDFRQYTNSRHAIAVSSCTAGLHLALDVLGIGPGDEVITTPITFPATANVILHQGASPIFVDVNRFTMNIDSSLIERAITSRTKALIPVHMTGRPCCMDEVMDIARRHNVFVIEDAAHAIESWYMGKKIGSIGDITAFSFYVTKNICTGEGGMITTNNKAWADEIRIKGLHGISSDAWKRYTSEGFYPYDTLYPGYKYNMTDIQASLGIHQLARLERNLIIREKHWRSYDQAFYDIPEILLPDSQLPPGSRHARHLYTIMLDLDKVQVTRNKFVEALRTRNIGTGVHFTALHLHKYYREKLGFKQGDFPNSEWIGDRVLSLPLSAKLTDEDIQYVIDSVRQVVKDHSH